MPDTPDDLALIACQRELATARETITNLEAALLTARRIGAAIGIVMTRYGLTESAAFELLRATSQRLNRKVRDVADDVVFTGTVPGGVA